MKSLERPSSGELGAEQVRQLVIEHAALVAEFVQTQNSELLHEIKTIEEKLGMTGDEIAQKAVSIYHEQYRRSP